MKLIKKIAAVVLGAILVGGALTGCGSEKAPSSENLNFGCINYSDSLDPSAMINASWCVTRFGIGECLFKFDDDMSAQNNLCDKYTVDDSKTTWTFHIREGVKFSNGKELTPCAVQASIQYMYDQEAGAQGNSTPSMYMDMESIKGDDNTGNVTIVTKKPITDLCSVLAHPYFSILDVKSGENMGENPIGTGPYAIEKYDTGVSLGMKANENYWNGEVPYKTVNIIFISDSTTKAMALENGDVDVVENITTPGDLQKLKKNEDYKIAEAVGIRCGFSYMNQKGVLGNEDLRKAILMALDDKTMCDVTVGGMYTAGYSVLPSALDYGYKNLTDATPYNVKEAKSILDKANIVDGDGDGYRELNGKNINLSYLTYDSRNLIDFTEAVVSYLDKIGIKATIKTTDADTEWNMLTSGEYDLLANNWMTVPVGDPYSYLDNWYSKSKANYCGYANNEYDTLYEELANETESDARSGIIEKLQQILINDAAVLVHGYYHSNMCSNKNIEGASIPTADYYWLTTNIKPAK
ncbi:MAG: ABC transporter substrate-binding protein [Clostridiales bacterium]